MRNNHDNPRTGIGGLGPAREELRRMAASPGMLERPLLVMSGYRATRQLSAALAADLGRLFTSAARIVPVSFFSASSFDAACGVVRAVLEREGLADQELDIVGVSMGGLVGRTLALPGEGHVRVRRLFTLCTPHRGARLAEVLAPDPAAIAMVGGSAHLARLDDALPSAQYELVCYARTRDWWVGTDRCAPPGHEAIVLETPPASLGHLLCSRDPRAQADIGRRLRSEPPWLAP